MEASEAQWQGHGRPYLSSWGEEEKVLHVSENSRLVQVEKKKKKKKSQQMSAVHPDFNHAAAISCSERASVGMTVHNSEYRRLDTEEAE